MKTVKNIMRRHVLTVTQDTDIVSIWHLIFVKGIHALPVIDASNKLVGILSEEDLLQKMSPDYSEFLEHIDTSKEELLSEQITKIKKSRAKDLMNKVVFCTNPDAYLFKTLARMLVLQVRQLPVTNDKNEVIGIVSKGDIFNEIFEAYLRTQK